MKTCPAQCQCPCPKVLGWWSLLSLLHIPKYSQLSRPELSQQPQLRMYHPPNPGSHSSTVADTQWQTHQYSSPSEPALDAAIKDLNFAWDISSITPAQAAFDSVSALLTSIRVCFLLSGNWILQVHVQPGLDVQRTRLHRSWVVVCRCMWNPWPGDQRETIRRAQPVSARGDRTTDYMGRTCNAYDVYFAC